MKTQWQNNYRCKERMSRCRIGLVKHHGGHLVNQTRLLFLTNVEKTQLKIK